MQSAEKSDYASYAQALFSVSLEISRGFSVGPVSGEVHMSESNTQTIACVNVYDLYYSLSDRVIEWANG